MCVGKHNHIQIKNSRSITEELRPDLQSNHEALLNPDLVKSRDRSARMEENGLSREMSAALKRSRPDAGRRLPPA